MAGIQDKGKKSSSRIVLRVFCFQIYRRAKMYFHTEHIPRLFFHCLYKGSTLFLKRGNPPLKLWNTDTASFILAKVDWADDVDPLYLDSIKGFAIFISQARCSSSSVGIISRRGVRVCWSKRKSHPDTKKSHEENGYYLHWSLNNLGSALFSSDRSMA